MAVQMKVITVISLLIAALLAVVYAEKAAQNSTDITQLTSQRYTATVQNGRCCVADKCNGRTRCRRPRTLFRDSCGRAYKVTRRCRFVRRFSRDLRGRRCCFSDPCNSEMVCLRATRSNNLWTNYCQDRFEISTECRLNFRDTVKLPGFAPTEPVVRTSTTAVGSAKQFNFGGQFGCCYVDACNGASICSNAAGTLIDSCRVTYAVAANCALTRTGGRRNQRVPEIWTAANGFLPGNGFFNGVNWVNGLWGVGTNGVVTQNQCCFTDACSSALICSVAGGRLWDSCLVDYSVGTGCSLTRVSEVTNQVVLVAAQNLENFGPFFE